MPFSRHRVVLLAVFAIALVLGVVALVASGGGGEEGAEDPDPPERLDVAVVGDSFALQSRDQMLALADERGIDMEVHAVGGASICAFHERFAELEADPPRRLVLSFAGNDLSSCTNPTCDDTIGHESCTTRPPEVVAGVYREQIDQLLADFAGDGVEFYVVLPPPNGEPQFEANAAAMRVMYRALVAEIPSIRLVDSAVALDPTGQGFQPTLPCAEWDTECQPDGQVVVRQPDQVHLTPAGGERYARAVLDALAPA